MYHVSAVTIITIWNCYKVFAPQFGVLFELHCLLPIIFLKLVQTFLLHILKKKKAQGSASA